jgi:hypothetical protein
MGTQEDQELTPAWDTDGLGEVDLMRSRFPYPNGFHGGVGRVSNLLGNDVYQAGMHPPGRIERGSLHEVFAILRRLKANAQCLIAKFMVDPEEARRPAGRFIDAVVIAKLDVASAAGGSTRRATSLGVRALYDAGSRRSMDSESGGCQAHSNYCD